MSAAYNILTCLLLCELVKSDKLQDAAKVVAALPAVTSTGSSTYKFTLAPIEVRGQHLYDSKTGKQFRAKGIDFPNLPASASVDEWVKTLQRIKTESSKINAVRLYIPPPCASSSDCFRVFMEQADSLGVYVLVPGTGTTSGWLPNDPTTACVPKDSPSSGPTANGCYKNGGVLGFGQNIIQRFNFPNTLAITIGNEVDMQRMWKYAAMLKGYARDLKSHMQMCNNNTESPTKGTMRNIPLIYAKSDDGGDPSAQAWAKFLFCGGSNISIDIFGLNNERYCDDTGGGAGQYQGIDKWVTANKFPGAYMQTEEGCPNTHFPNNSRTWGQVKGYFQNYPAIDGFFGYTYYDGQPMWGMFDGPTSTAQISQDGKNFFQQVTNYGEEPVIAAVPPVIPDCAASKLEPDMFSIESVQWYDTGAAGLAKNCPVPYQSAETAESESMVIV